MHVSFRRTWRRIEASSDWTFVTETIREWSIDGSGSLSQIGPWVMEVQLISPSVPSFIDPFNKHVWPAGRLLPTADLQGSMNEIGHTSSSLNTELLQQIWKFRFSGYRDTDSLINGNFIPFFPALPPAVFFCRSWKRAQFWHCLCSRSIQ